MKLFERVRNAVDAFLVRAPKMPRGLGTQVIPDLPIWLQFTRIGGQVTPTELSNIVRVADTGDMRRLMDLANDARQKDCHLQAVLAQSEESISGLDWQLELPKTAKARERRALDFVENHLRIEVPAPFSSLLAHQSGCVYYGHAVSETAWGKDDKSRLVPNDWDTLAPRRFGYRPDNGHFVWRDIGMSIEGIDFREEFPNQFVLSQPRVTGDVPCREGLVRVLMWAALFRNWAMTDWLRTGEIAWKPWRIGKYTKGTTTIEDVDALVNALERLASTGTAVLPDSVEYEIKWPQGTTSSNPTHSELFNVVAMEMSKAVLGQTETVQSSTSSGYAQAKVHQAVRADILRARARKLAAEITRDVIRPMIELNFGKDFAVPRFVFITDDVEDLQTFGVGIKNLVGAGLKMPAPWVRKRVGIPEPEEGEETIGGPPPAPEPGEPGPGGEGEEKPDEEATPTETEPGNEPPVEEQPKKAA